MPAGQPPYYTSADEMQIEIDKYFKLCADPEKRIRPTVTGLALALGFASRQSLLDYEEKGEFFYTLKRAKLKVENYIEERLYEANATGSIFNLKNNFGWKDKTEVDTNSKVQIESSEQEVLNKLKEFQEDAKNRINPPTANQ